MPSSLRSSPLTHTCNARPRARLVLGTIVSVAILSVAAGWSAACAQADGDPASDVLAAQALFVPQDAGLHPGEQEQLGALVASAQRSGYPIRVALIASAADLGSITELWRRPQSYVLFLAQELSMIYRGALLVVMPGGFGVAVVGRHAGAQSAALGGLRSPPAGELGTAALTAIRRLAAAAGRVLPVGRGAPVAGGGPGSRSEAGDALAWLVFVLGTVAIALAWAASLRARPLGGTDRVSRRARSSRTSP